MIESKIKISLKFVPGSPIDNKPGLIQVMAWRQTGDKPLPEPMMASLLMHICITQPQCSGTYQLQTWFKKYNI